MCNLYIYYLFYALVVVKQSIVKHCLNTGAVWPSSSYRPNLKVEDMPDRCDCINNLLWDTSQTGILGQSMLFGTSMELGIIHLWFTFIKLKYAFTVYIFPNQLIRKIGLLVHTCITLYYFSSYQQLWAADPVRHICL